MKCVLVCVDIRVLYYASVRMIQKRKQKNIEQDWAKHRKIGFVKMAAIVEFNKIVFKFKKILKVIRLLLFLIECLNYRLVKSTKLYFRTDQL